MTWLFSLLTGLPGMLNGLLTYLNKKQDNALEQFRIGNTNGKDVSIAVIQAEIARNTNVKDMTLGMMSHPVFWIAWGFGVFPVLLYHACIFWVSTFPGLGWTVLKVPDVELEYARLVVGSVFTLTGCSTVVSGIAHAWTKRA